MNSSSGLGVRGSWPQDVEDVRQIADAPVRLAWMEGSEVVHSRRPSPPGLFDIVMVSSLILRRKCRRRRSLRGVRI